MVLEAGTLRKGVAGASQAPCRQTVSPNIAPNQTFGAVRAGVAAESPGQAPPTPGKICRPRMTRSHFTGDTSRLVLSPACAAILVDGAGRYLLQLRDDIPGIWYPGHWGLFGGAIESGETPLAALCRELHEELGLDLPPERLAPVLRLDIALAGLDPRPRHVFAATLDAAEAAALVLGEGAGLDWVDGATALTALPLAPYDALALFLHRGRARLS